MYDSNIQNMDNYKIQNFENFIKEFISNKEKQDNLTEKFKTIVKKAEENVFGKNPLDNSFNKTEFLEHIKPISTKNKKSRPDNSKKAKGFYKEYFNNIYNEKSFTGETIISYKTIAGCALRTTKDYYKNFKTYNMPEDNYGRLIMILGEDYKDINDKDKDINDKDKDINDKDKDINDNIKDKFVIFCFLVNTLANFMPLPEGKLNISKGNYATYHDFPDLFFKEIKNYTQLFMEDNEKQKWWKNLVETNHLESLFIDGNYEEFKQITPAEAKTEPEMPYTNPYNKNGEFKKNEYRDPKDGKITEQGQKSIFDRIEVFLDNSINFIVERNFQLIKYKKI